MAATPHNPPSHLLEPYHYISSTPGKNIRSALIDCFQLWLHVEPISPSAKTTSDASNDESRKDDATNTIDVLSEIKSIIASLHNASLLIDDIEDNSKLRRGNPVAHSIFGMANCINCANYVYFLALEKVEGLGNEVALKEMLNLHRGQGHDIYSRDSSIIPTESEYISMVIDKTGGLFRLAVGLMQAFATHHQHTDFVPLVNNLGLYFQIRDDLINLADEEYFKSKSYCEDLTEGKFSYPIIHCIRSNDDGEINNDPGNNFTMSSRGNQLYNILKQRTEDVDVKRYAQRLMFESGSLDYTREKCTQLKMEVIGQIEELGGNESLLKVIEMLDLQVEKIAGDGEFGVLKENGSKNLDYT
eukprot:scaffold25630_cov78-Cyclotella_meneghiniana.AAC.14